MEAVGNISVTKIKYWLHSEHRVRFNGLDEAGENRVYSCLDCADATWKVAHDPKGELDSEEAPEG